MFDSWQRRKAEAEINAKLKVEIQAILTNPNYDNPAKNGERPDKSQIIRDLTESCWDAIDRIYDLEPVEDAASRMLKEHPFFTSMRVPKLPVIDDATMDDAAETLGARAAQEPPEIDQPL